ncbi:MAG TPA: glycosyltransferase family 39 protein, partial [Gemmataceae bacterium]|nr:glycosyltransferase family 39 protein [Gemmataceae bacterium]
MTNATDGPPLANRLEGLSPPKVRLAPPVMVASPATPPTLPRLPSPAKLLVALVLVGAGLRAGAMMNDRCLWIDESMLALNLIERTPAQLFEPLDWNQGAPVGFLLAAKASIAVFGPSEFGLRFVPFLGSVIGLALFAGVSRRLLPAPAALLATGLMAVSPYLLSYSAECKQYVTDATITAGLFALSIGLLRGEGSLGRWAALGLGGAAAVWFSHPSTFVLGGIGTALLAQALLARDRGRFVAAALTVGCWLASFGVCYLLCLRQLGANQYLLDYWNGHFLPLPPKSISDLTWLLDHFFTFFAFPGGLGGTEIRAGGIAAALFVVGVIGFWRERWPVAVALVLPA